MISNKEVLDRVVDRYDTYELVELLELEEVVPEEIYDTEIEDFVKVYKKLIINNREELDIW